MTVRKQNYSIIKLAVEKGIRDIKENPQRSMRNLIDLGEMFAGGRFQKEFFENARIELENEESPYYRLVERVLHGVDAKRILSFGMNLGYNCWTAGAKQIRKLEASEGFNIPWCLFIELVGENGCLDIHALARLISQGRELGIFCYVIGVDEGYPQSGELISLMQAESDCAFVLFMRPGLVSHETIEQLEAVPNSWVLLDMDEDNDAQLSQAVAMLQGSGILCGGYTHYMDFDAQAEAKLEEADKLDLPFLMLAQTKNRHPLFTDDVSKQLSELRKNLKYSVLPIDVFYDVANIDRNISSEACLTAVTANGDVVMSDEQKPSVKTPQNIHEVSLNEILRTNAPKQG